MSSVWMWHFQEPSPPTITIESPMPAQASFRRSSAPAGPSSMNMTS